nr:reverse transcriptase [Tanacetum cinerariifolium]
MKLEESLNVTFNEIPPPPKTSPLEDDDLVEEQAIEDVIENGNSFKPFLQTVEGSLTPYIPGPVTADKNIQMKNDVKAESMLLMALPNEHLMTFNQYKDAKSFFDAITTRFDGNNATRKTQKTLLKQMYKNFKVKRNTGPSLSSGSQNMAFVSTPSTSNNDDVSTVFAVSTASSQVSTTNLSDATVYAFLANQPNGPELMHEDLEQIYEDDLEEIDLKWQLALLSMRAKRIVNVEDTSSKAMVVIDGAGFDWSYMANDEAPTSMAFMDFSDSEMCDKKNSVLFTDTECVFMSLDSKLADESHVLLKVPRKNNMYSVYMKNIIPIKDLTCLVAMTINDESMLWNRRLGHINFKNINKLVKENLDRATKDETSRIFKREYSVAGTPQQNKAEAVNTACYVQNRTIWECLMENQMKGSLLATLQIVKLSEYKTLELRSDGPKWLFNIDALTESMNYVPVIVGTNSNDFARKGASFDADSNGDNKDNDGPCKESEIDNQERPNAKNSTKDVNTTRPSINTASLNINTASLTVNIVRQSDDLFDADTDMRSLDGVEMDVTRAFLYERIKEEVYVCQPPGFEDTEYPDKVYKVEKALYGLYQAPRAWYETLAKYLLDNGFHRGKIDQTLFIKRQKVDILLVQVQDKYVDETLSKFKYTDVKPASTPMDKEKALLKDSNGDDVDIHLYSS